ncbi:MAG: DUF624 domain-containing protein [Enterococcus faecalis]|nr:DUF624 domain-containing protein [Enterococcus faecalis]
MFTKQTFDNNIYMKIFRWLYILFIGNLGLLLVNIPFFIAVISLDIDPRNLPLFVVTLLPIGAGMIALLGLIDTFKEEKELDPFKTFFQKFRQFGFRGFLISLLGLGSSIISVTDIFFFAKTTIGKWFIPLMVLLLIFGLAIMLNAWYFQVRNPQASFKDVFRISIYYGLRKWYVSCLNVFLLFSMFAMMFLKPQFGFVVTPVLFLGIIYLNTGKLHEKQKKNK